MNGNNRSDIAPGIRVRVVRKSPHHPHGIKVRLEGGIVGRVKEILDA